MKIVPDIGNAKVRPSADERAPFCRIRATGNTWSIERFYGGEYPVAGMVTGVYSMDTAIHIGELLDADLATYAAQLAGVQYEFPEMTPPPALGPDGDVDAAPPTFRTLLAFTGRLWRTWFHDTRPRWPGHWHAWRRR